MLDRFNRKITYLRISVTDRCNLRCTYCMPAEGVAFKPKKDLLTTEEILEIVRVGVILGITKVRLTGGEPLVRDDIVQLIRELNKIEGLQDIGLTTNGTLLAAMAEDLKKAGLKRINISLDTLDPEKYRQITRRGELSDVLAGIEAAIANRFDPIKINCVIIPGKNEEDIPELRKFCEQKNLQLRFIRQMDLKTGKFYPVEGGQGGICSICNRLRLTADGYIKPCLFSDLGYSVRELGIERAFKLAVENKPLNGTRALKHNFYNIGG